MLRGLKRFPRCLVPVPPTDCTLFDGSCPLTPCLRDGERGCCWGCPATRRSKPRRREARCSPPHPPRYGRQPKRHISFPWQSCSCLSTRCQEHSGNGKSTSLPAPSEPRAFPSGTSQRRSPQPLLTPSPSEASPPGSPEPPRAGTPLTQQDEGDEQHDEDGDAEDERKPSLAHAGSSEHGGSWQQGGGRVRGSGCLPRVPGPCCLPARARSSPEDPQDVGEQGRAHPAPPRGIPPSCHGPCPLPCPRHPSHPQGNTSLWLRLVPAAGAGTQFPTSLHPSPPQVGPGPGWPETTLGTILLRVLSQVVQGAGAGLESGL